MVQLAVDAIVQKEDKVLLIERMYPPFGMALPGGRVENNESCEEACARELKEETALNVIEMEQLGTYSKPQRDPRGRTVSVVYVVKTEGDPIAGDDAKSFKWVSLDELTPSMLAFDHYDILKDYKNFKARRDILKI